VNGSVTNQQARCDFSVWSLVFMSFFADRNRIYLALFYLLLSLVCLSWVVSKDGTPLTLLAYAVVLLALILTTHASLLRIIAQATGQSSPINELSYFSAFIDLIRNIHHLLEVDDVLRVVNTTLRERVYVTTTHYWLGAELPSALLKRRGGEVPGAERTGALRSWPEPHVYPVDMVAFAKEVLKTNKVLTLAEASPYLKEVFTATNTNLLLPVIQNEQVLAVLLLGRADNHKAYSEVEMQAYSYLANQLTLILDRIRVYAKVLQKTAMDHAEKLQVMQSLSANIAHEMRTPLSGIRASISGIEEYLPQLLDSHLWCMEHAKEQFPVIRDSHLNVLTSTPRRIKLMIDQANTVIDMLLMNLRENSLDRKQFNAISARDIIEQAIDRYPFKSGQREKLSLDLGEDFRFLGVESLCIYVFFNLLKNAFYSIQSAQKGEIHISLRRIGGEGKIYFRDTGLGISQEILAKIFDGFFTTKQEGTGAGLAFCRRTAETFNGSITCHSEPNRYAEFVLTLPLIKDATHGSSID
jgi:signal transduction histidine kinase